MSLLRPRSILRIRIWLGERWPQYHDLSILVYAGIVGIGGALASVGFRMAISAVQWALTGHTGSLVETASEIPPWERLVIPALGALLAGWVLQAGLRLTRGEQAKDYMETIRVGDGLVPIRTSLLKSCSSLFTIASGGSIGREGPMVQLSALLGSGLGRVAQLPPPRLRLLVACGAAAGIASAYKTPLTAALFVAEIILGSIAAESLGPLVFSSVMSTITTHQILGASPTYEIHGFRVTSNWEFLFYCLLGLLAGGIGVGFLKLLKLSKVLLHRHVDGLTPRLVVGGLIVGAISTQCPQVWGNGYSVVNFLLSHPMIWTILLGILVCKIAATAAVSGSGAIGGVLTPSLFMGAALGELVGQGLRAIFPGIISSPEAYALVGMGCFLAATTQAPLVAILMIFELTLQYEVVLPLMLACVTAVLISRSLTSEPVYFVSPSPSAPGPVPATPRPVLVRELMQAHPLAVGTRTPMTEIMAVFKTHRFNYLYVTDSADAFRGALSLHELKPYLNDETLGTLVLAIDLVQEDFPVLRQSQSLSAALEVFRGHQLERIPVIDDSPSRRLVGALFKTDLLLSLTSERPSPGPGAPPPAKEAAGEPGKAG